MYAADAATYPLHWIYDVTKVKDLVKGGRQDTPEFFLTPSCPFYNSGPVGVQSCYGDGGSRAACQRGHQLFLPYQQLLFSRIHPQN